MSAAHKAALGGAAKKGGGDKQEQLQAPIWCPENTCSVSGRGKIEGRSGPREGHAEFEVMGGWKRVDPGCRVDAGMCDCAGLRPLPEHRVQSTGRWGSSLKRGGSTPSLRKEQALDPSDTDGTVLPCLGITSSDQKPENRDSSSGVQARVQQLLPL